MPLTRRSALTSLRKANSDVMCCSVQRVVLRQELKFIRLGERKIHSKIYSPRPSLLLKDKLKVAQDVLKIDCWHIKVDILLSVVLHCSFSHDKCFTFPGDIQRLC